ncbi:hypothetical protein BYT27DRAFT_6848701 [Phlegmacium glaucopus]|nr:hypothetical protein BYT27DRAFT_6848701 [Phlegmacium glaucopus]
MSLFSKLPLEIISQFSFILLADQPLGPPHGLLPIALTCRSFNAIVTSKQFLAKLCRFKFDVRAINRRSFHPRDRDLADELIRCCFLLKEIRRADVAETESVVDDTLWASYILMLNNDGKNYAQLQHAGLDAYVDKFVMTRLWEGRESNQGWPLDSANNSLALWLMWMTLTKEKLLAESPAAREQIILLTLPYVVLPHRYASASAPPNHFNLPLDTRNPYHQQPLITTLSPATPYPIYIQIPPINAPYFNARMPISAPIITIAAKLLFVARKEMSPTRAPPHLPQGPGEGVVGITQEDYREINKNPAARLCRVVRWDWDTGCPRRVGSDGVEGSDGDEMEEGWEESKVWDTEWWRRLLCGACTVQRPKYLPGDVFKLGSMRGSWHGKEYLPQGTLFVHFLRHPNIYYPGIPDEHRPHLFTEGSIGLLMKPVFLDVQEHHKICECPQGSADNDSHPYTTATSSFTPNASSTSTSLRIVSQTGRCGVVPVPAPLVFVTRRQPTNQQAHAAADADENEDINVDAAADDPQPQPSEALALSLPTPEINIIDYSMSNAWFPGHVGGVSFAKMPTTTGPNSKRDKIICAVDFQAPDIRSVLNKPEASECLALGGVRRRQGQAEKMNAYVYETYDPEKTSTHRGLEMGDSISAHAFTPISTSGTNPNPSVDTSDPLKCPRCVQREVLIRLERKKAEEYSKRVLDRGLRSYGRMGTDWDGDRDMYYEADMEEAVEEEGEEEGEEGEEEGDEEMQDLDVTGLNIDFEGIDRAVAEATSSLSPSSPPQTQRSSSLSPIMTFGDDKPYGEPGSYNPSEMTTLEPTRRLYDKSRIGVECMGVGDILLSGETGPRHTIWHQYTMYGRIRPWDGLIGILRSTPAASNNNNSNIFIFGYIVGENNFVGEWRLAASDPLRPTWGGAFVMGRRASGEQAAQAPVSSGA